MNLVSRAFHAVLLLALLVVDTPVLPGLLAISAELEGEHEVLVFTTSGHTQVVLHHREGNETLLPHDHATSLARILCELSSLNEAHDHQFGFSSNDNATQVQRRIVISVASSPWIASLQRWTSPLLSLSTTAVNITPAIPLSDLGRLEAFLHTPHQSHGIVSLLV